MDLYYLVGTNMPLIYLLLFIYFLRWNIIQLLKNILFIYLTFYSLPAPPLPPTGN